MASAERNQPYDDKQPFEIKRPAERARSGARGFWNRISEGMELQELWSQFKSDAQASYGHYSQDVDWTEIDKEKGFRRALKIAKAFAMAMLMKLSPVRRVLLLLALGMLVFGRVEYRGDGASASFNLAAFGVVLLLLLLAMELADRVTMKRDLEIAKEIQRWLVPAEPPAVSGADIAFTTRAANTVAGDYYDAFYRGDAGSDSRRLMLVVADVAGKSVPAALLMATLQASLQALAGATGSLVELVSKLNGYACAHSLGGMRFTTAFLAEFDPAGRGLTYVCAGHNAAALKHAAGGPLERLDVGGLPLGISADARYDFASVKLEPGDTLLVFTDGLPEALNEKGEEFSDARLAGVFSSLPAAPAKETLARIMGEVDGFVGATRQHDDITAMVVHIR